LRYLIVNADDFGYARGINRGIIEAHERGIVTSTTMIVNGRAVDEAVALSRSHPELSIGLHVNFTNEGERLVEFDDPRVCRAELRRQFQMFRDLMGRLPTHIDSHQHVHRATSRRPFFQELASEFYAQWEHGVSDPSKVSVEAITRLVQQEMPEGVFELSCHPGYADPDFECVYLADRELELATLCDPRTRRMLDADGIALIGYAQLPQKVAWFPRA
jgi:predicted glycoside hydrolase/deacetylase ChbG (UPF0249 family)